MSDFKLGEHEAMIKTLDTRTAAMAVDIGEIKDILAERRGERNTVAKVAAVSSILVTALFKLGGLVYAAMRHA